MRESVDLIDYITALVIGILSSLIGHYIWEKLQKPKRSAEPHIAPKGLFFSKKVIVMSGIILCFISMFLGLFGYTDQIDIHEGLLAFMMTFFMGTLPFLIVYLGIKRMNKALVFLGALYGIAGLSISTFLFFDDAEYLILFFGGIFQFVSILILFFLLSAEIGNVLTKYLS